MKECRWPGGGKTCKLLITRQTRIQLSHQGRPNTPSVYVGVAINTIIFYVMGPFLPPWEDLDGVGRGRGLGWDSICRQQAQGQWCIVDQQLIDFCVPNKPYVVYTHMLSTIISLVYSSCSSLCFLLWHCYILLFFIVTLLQFIVFTVTSNFLVLFLDCHLKKLKSVIFF